MNAKGLQILLHHMEEQHNLVNQAYRTCVNARLQEVIDGTGDKYIENHDDGEIDAQTEEMGEYAGVATEPPMDSRFWYVPSEDGGEWVPASVALEIKQRQNTELNAKLSALEDAMEALRADRDRVSEALNHRIAQLENEMESKYARDNSFSLKTLLRDLDIEIPHDRINALCKRVVNQYKESHPGAQLTTRHRVVYFHPDMREEIVGIVRQVHLNMDLALMAKMHRVVNVGVDRL